MNRKHTRNLILAALLLSIAFAAAWQLVGDINMNQADGKTVVTPLTAPAGGTYWRIQPGPANAWLLPIDSGEQGHEDYFLIDTGYPHDYEHFRQGLAAAGIDITRIRALLLTHAHDEHVGFAARLKRETGCRLIIPRQALPALARGTFVWKGVSLNPLVEVSAQLYNTIMQRDFRFEPVLPASDDIILDADSPITPQQWGLKGRFLSTPGHSADSWSLILDDGRAFVGDAAMNFLQPLGSGYRPVFMEDRRETYRSLERIRRAGAQLILSGHGEPFTVEKLPRFQESAPRGPGLTGLLAYLLRLVPGLTLFFLLLVLTRGAPRIHRIWLYILAFILIRDLMTPLGLWRVGTDPVLWLRFAADGPVLVLLAAGSLGMSLGLYRFERRRGSSFPWFRHGKLQPVLAGVLGALVVSAPVLLLRSGILPGERGGPFPLELAPALLLLALAGNLLEELIFRGYLHQELQDHGLSPLRAALSSGVAFGFGHSFLAFTVTSAGLPLLLFALWEGCLCGVLRMRYGLTAAILTHGLAIWLITLL